jgi:nucleoside-diphosphate-sugar epimerase
LRAAYAAAFLMEAWCVLNGRRRRPSLTRFGLNLVALDYDEDCTRLRSELGWVPAVSLREAVRRTAESREEQHATV